MKIYLIRHSITMGNQKRRYIGRTDEPLATEGKDLLKERIAKGVYPLADRIFVSPMKRCIQTAQILYPGQAFTVIGELSECDFGKFENKNYEELKDTPEYREWLDSKGAMGFPGGESKESFSKRSLKGFEKALKMSDGEAAVFIVHGGTIMSIMEKYAVPRGAYYDFQIGNGEGYELILEDVFAPGGGIYSGSDTGRPGMAVSSGADDRSAGHIRGKNYKKLPA